MGFGRPENGANLGRPAGLHAGEATPLGGGRLGAPGFPPGHT